ncbi:histidinolphosphatase [Cladochytrium tenue]|nr:histidinolphosphatase [Cladochytrium tenue]
MDGNGGGGVRTRASAAPAAVIPGPARVSLHSHSGQFCRHARGDLAEVVRAAIDAGFRIYGLSEHMPRSRVQDLYPEEKDMTPEDTAVAYRDFVAEARRLQAQHAGEIRLLVGMETELIHDSTLDELQALRSRHALDYIVGSLHHVNGVPIDFDEAMYAAAEAAAGAREPSLAPTEALFRQYFDAQMELLRGCRPDVVGHFDLIRIFRPGFALSPEVWARVERNVAFVAEYGGLVEVNSRAWKKNLPDAYPFRDILQLMISRGVKFTLSDDSHGPADVGMFYDKLHDYVREMGVTAVHWPGGGVASV